MSDKPQDDEKIIEEKIGQDIPKETQDRQAQAYNQSTDEWLRNNAPSRDEIETWWKQHGRKVKIVAICGVVYMLNKRALRKVVRSELIRFDEFDIERALSPEWQNRVTQSLIQNGTFNRF